MGQIQRVLPVVVEATDNIPGGGICNTDALPQLGGGAGGWKRTMVVAAAVVVQVDNWNNVTTAFKNMPADNGEMDIQQQSLGKKTL